jgi:hypothetical protein
MKGVGSAHPESAIALNTPRVRLYRNRGYFRFIVAFISRRLRRIGIRGQESRFIAMMIVLKSIVGISVARLGYHRCRARTVPISHERAVRAVPFATA